MTRANWYFFFYANIILIYSKKASVFGFAFPVQELEILSWVIYDLLTDTKLSQHSFHKMSIHLIKR